MSHGRNRYQPARIRPRLLGARRLAPRRPRSAPPPLPAAAVTGAVLGALLLSAAPSRAEPSVEQVSDRVDRLYHQAEQAQERYHDATLRLTGLRADLRSLRAAQARRRERLDAVAENVEDAVLHAYEGAGVAAVSRVLVAEDPREFLAQMSAVSAFTEQQTSLYDDYERRLDALRESRRATRARVDDVAGTARQLGRERATVRERLSEAKDLLAELEAAERRELEAAAAESAQPAPAGVPASGRAGAAVQYALAQVGDTYVYGAAGPEAFDCSGLTMMAWAQAGVGLPHSSNAQAASGSPVAAGELQPGDLVFYYRPISHVGIYVGDGLIVHAANPATDVQVTGVFSMPFAGAVRPG